MPVLRRPVEPADQRWTVGFGARLITPTGGDTFGSGKWQIMPGGGFRYALWEVNSSSYFEPVVRYDVSFAGDPTRKNISRNSRRRSTSVFRPLVHHLLTKPGHSHQLRRPDHQPDRPAVPALRRQNWTPVGEQLSFELGVPMRDEIEVRQRRGGDIMPRLQQSTERRKDIRLAELRTTQSGA